MQVAIKMEEIIMTIRDLIEQGIQLQGWIKVIKWDSDMEKSEIISYTPSANGENIAEEALDLEIKYMYAEDSDFIIEVIETEE